MTALMETVPDFELPATDNQQFRLSAMHGAPLVLYFYPKDDTPGCTDEGLQFKSLHQAFADLKCTILGVSRVSLQSEEKFGEKMDFPFHMRRDENEVACTLFDVMKMKNMYGKQVRGIQRSTFLIDSAGRLRAEWRGVSVPGHALAVLDTLKSI